MKCWYNWKGCFLFQTKVCPVCSVFGFCGPFHTLIVVISDFVALYKNSLGLIPALSILCNVHLGEQLRVNSHVYFTQNKVKQIIKLLLQGLYIYIYTHINKKSAPDLRFLLTFIKMHNRKWFDRIFYKKKKIRSKHTTIHLKISLKRAGESKTRNWIHAPVRLLLYVLVMHSCTMYSRTTSHFLHKATICLFIITRLWQSLNFN